MDRTFNELLGYFCLDRKKATIDEFFGDLNNFVKDFEVRMYIRMYSTVYTVRSCLHMHIHIRTYVFSL